jgi:DNA-binding NtrC family response regulator
MKRPLQALVVDDEPQMRSFVAEVLRADGWEVTEAETAEEAFERLREREWALVFCDVLLGGADGFEVLGRFTVEQPEAQVVLMTGAGSAADALDATSQGAYDYLLKPFSVDGVQALSRSVRMRLEARERQHDAGEDDAGTNNVARDVDLVGKSEAFVEVMKLVGRVSHTSLPVLITGESGTGKEVVAVAIHRHSPRANRPFVAVNCGALPSQLIEAELFGHVRGSFTGAERDRRGLFEEANGGTIFLDEITETPLSFQVKLLRALQKGEIRCVGSNQVVRVDVRVIAASNRDVEDEAKHGRFRQDLLYRLNAVTIHLPPLRERRADILPLARHSAARVRAAGDPRIRFSREASHLLETYSWPGNIRELENAVARAVTLCDHTIRPEDLPLQIQRQQIVVQPDAQRALAKAVPEIFEDWPPLAEIQARYVAHVLEHTGGNKRAATRLLQIDPKTLDRIIKRHNIAFARVGKESERRNSA